MKNINNIVLSKDAPVANVIDKIDQYGVVILSRYLDENSLNYLEKEFSCAFQTSDSAFYAKHNHTINKLGKVARCKTEKLGVDFKVTRKVFLSDEMREISGEYFGKENILLNDDVFFTHEKESSNPIFPWHFDRQQALKFYINLIDVDQKNGAFEYDLGSHREGHFRANYYIQRGDSIASIPNDIPENELHNPVTIKARAGDLIIFDADGFHRGGTIAKGMERKVIRGHSHPIPNRGYQASLLDAHWWLQQKINLAGLLANSTGRVLPHERLTKAVLTRK